MSLKTVLFYVNIALVVAIVISGFYLGLMIFKEPEQKIPTGVTYNVHYISAMQVKVEFGNFSSNITFPDAYIEVTSPSNDVSKADVRNGTLEYPQNTTLKSLSNIHLSSTGLLDKGISFTMMNYKNLQQGPWSFKLIHRGTGIQMSGGTIIVPDVDTTPEGTFDDPLMISASEVRLGIKSVTPATGYTSCYVRVWGPGMINITSPYINDTTSMSFRMSDGTVVTIVDANKDGLVNSGDYISLRVEGRSLLKGAWAISMNYRFTNNDIATETFNIS